jgi:hypothetical protein
MKSRPMSQKELVVRVSVAFTIIAWMLYSFSVLSFTIDTYVFHELCENSTPNSIPTYFDGELLYCMPFYYYTENESMTDFVEWRFVK